MAEDLLKSIIMKKTFLLFNIVVFLFCLNALAQKPVIELTFTGINNDQWIPIENIVIKNITRGVDTTIYYPDTVLMLHYQVGINDVYQGQNNGLKLFQNYPNPVKDQTTFTVDIPDKDVVNIIVNDALGRVVITKKLLLDKGQHSFKFKPASDPIYFVTANCNGSSSSIKIINGSNNLNQKTSLEYIQVEHIGSQYKNTAQVQDFSFDVGDDLIFVANATSLESGIFDEPDTDMFYTFQFATNIPCPGDSSVTYEGITYNTIQIFSQCWFMENLNIGTMISGTAEMEDNNTIEKYCYANSQDSCDKYGGLYQWNELMQYTTTDGSQGICPEGWHIPTNNDWIILSGAADSQYSYGESLWYDAGYNGFDAGKNLKSEIDWLEDGNGTNSFGFIALPGGQRISNGYFDGVGLKANYWSSTDDFPEIIWYRSLSSFSDGIDRSSQSNTWGKSVRCIRD